MTPVDPLVIRVPGLPPSFNRRRIHKIQQYRDDKEYAELVYAVTIDARNWWEELNRRRWETLDVALVSLTFTTSARRGALPDEDNLRASFIPGMNALTARPRGDRVGAGIIKDDRPGCVRYGEVTVQRGHIDQVEVVIRKG